MAKRNYNRRNQVNNNERTGFLFMFLILVLLSFIIYNNKDKFLLAFSTNLNNKKLSIVPKKHNSNLFKGLFENLLNNKEENKNLVINENSTLVKKEPKRSYEKPTEKLSIIKDQTKKTENIKTTNNIKKENPNEKNINTKHISEQKNNIEKKNINISNNKNNEPVTKQNNTIKSNSNNIEKKEQPNIEKVINKQSIKIYFAKYNEDTGIRLSSVTRTVNLKDTPLTVALTTLIKGPNEYEASNDYISTIPPGTKINNIVVKNNIAYLDLSEHFLYNSYGSEGIKTQLNQIITTAFEFPTVNGVKILINGKSIDKVPNTNISLLNPLTRRL